MPRPRNTLISLEATPYYHCVSRCVRRAFLCGKDHNNGFNFEHRRGWIEERLLELATIFAIDIATYAVMSNHYHVILYVDTAHARSWSDREVAERWHRLFKGSLLSQRYYHDEVLTAAEDKVLAKEIASWRQRLMSISWFMRCLNEPIARAANLEDNVTGRFWEGRFKSQALLDEKALAACMAYVDLNPIRANMAISPETSSHTSIHRRIETVRTTALTKQTKQHSNGLLPFVGYPRNDMPKGLPFRLTDYLELVDCSGRIIREHKRGHIPSELPNILQRLELDIDARNWVYLTQHFEHPFKHLIGAADRMRSACTALGQRWVQGISHCERLFSSA